jgi:hypothetical protein
MSNKYRPDVAFPTELEQIGRHFASGINHPGEVDGLCGNIGITCGEARKPLLDALELRAGGVTELFVDSAAFSEVDFDEELGRLVDVAPITHADWLERFELYMWAGINFRTRALVVAPDHVGNQLDTLARLERYAVNVAAVASTRARIIVVVQGGEIPMSEMYARECAILGLREAPIAGIPMMKAATSIDDLRHFCASLPWYGARLHLLGIGPKARGGRYWDAIRAIKSIRPNAEITSDSALVPGLVGRKNGPGYGPRVLTRYQDEARFAGVRGATEIKAHALSRYSDDVRELELDAAHAAGWFDVELYDSLEEAVAHRAAGFPE